MATASSPLDGQFQAGELRDAELALEADAVRQCKAASGGYSYFDSPNPAAV